MAKHRKSFDDNAETHVLAEIVEESTGGDKGESSPVNSSGPFSLRSHDYTPLYSGGADPHATDVINIPNEPLVAERDPESPSSNRPAAWSWFWTGFGLTLLLLVIAAAVYIVSVNGSPHLCR